MSNDLITDLHAVATHMRYNSYATGCIHSLTEKLNTQVARIPLSALHDAIECPFHICHGTFFGKKHRSNKYIFVFELEITTIKLLKI